MRVSRAATHKMTRSNLGQVEGEEYEPNDQRTDAGGSRPYAGSVTPKRLLPLAATAMLLLSLAACSQAEPTSPTTESTAALTTAGACAGDEGVTLLVNASALDESPTETCVLASETIAASDVLERADVTTEGTEEYGDQVVCRVDERPAADEPLPNPDGSEYLETCASMPAAFAYWSLWVKPAGGEWDYAQEGLSTLMAEPGDSLALLFTLNGEPATP